MCNFESNPDQRSTGNEALSIRDPNAHRSRQTPLSPCRYSIRRYLPPLIGPKTSFSRRSLAGDAENKEEDCAEALTQDLRQHSNLLFRTVFRRLLVRNHKPRSTSGIACGVCHSPSCISHRTISENGPLPLPPIWSVRTPLLLSKVHGRF
jgi:hypothetical protein